MATPNKPQKINLTISNELTFSLMKKIYVRKKRKLPPITLKRMKPDGPI